jgi:hypothetical protein
VYTYTINIALNYKHILYTKVAYTNCLANSLNIFIGKTPVPNSSIPFAHPFINKKLYYNSGLSLNKSIDLTSTGL